MWGDDFDNADVLDVHTAAAYRYATTSAPYGENAPNGAERDRHRNLPGKGARIATFSEVNKQKLSALMKETTGEDPARPQRKLKKARKKSKLKESKQMLNHTAGELRPSSAAEAPATRNPNKASRRVKTANNDDVYRTLAGTMPAGLETVEPFDHGTLTHVEMFNVGVMKVIPSKPKHSATYILAPASAEEMAAAGNSFRKQVDLGGTGTISLDARQQTTAKAPEWIDLRDNYMRQVHASTNKILKLVEDAKADKGVQQHQHQQLTAADKRHFLLLLVAQRKVTLRIVSEYQYQAEEANIDPTNDALRASLATLRDYLVEVPSSLDHLDCMPFRSWIGVSPVLNPFLTAHRLDGAPSAASASAAKPTEVLLMTESETANCLRQSETLYELFQENLSRPRRPFQHTRNYADSEDEEPEDPSSEESAVLYQEGHDPQLKLLMTRTGEAVHNALHLGRERKAFTMGLAPLKTYWKYWRRAYANEQRVRDATITREGRNRRVCFDRLVHNTWQSVKFRSLQNGYHRRIVIITFGAWNEYRKWCKKFQSVHRRSALRLQHHYMLAWKVFTSECDDLRTFRRRSKNRIYSIAFQAFKHNAKLSKFELKKRLERRSTATFQDRHICRHIFQTWVRRTRVTARLDHLQDFVEKIEMKQALVRWVLLTFGPRSQRRARSVSQAKAYMLSLRSSFEKKVSSTYNFISSKLSKISPLMSAKDKADKEALREKTGETSRRLRMLQALEYAQKAYAEEAEVPTPVATKTAAAAPSADFPRRTEKKK